MKIPLVDLQAQYHSIKSEIDSAIGAILERSSFILGPEHDAFEREFASYCLAPHCAGVGSGTDAVYLALKALGIGPGDEVITAVNTFIATAEAISFAGAKPVFVDVLDDTQLIDPEKVERAVGPRTRAILPVHLFGQVCDMGPLGAIAEEHGLKLVEDCCQAHGAQWGVERAPVGSVGAFSFYPGKNLGAYGDGGAVVTRDAKVNSYVVEQRDHGRPLGGKHEHTSIGFGFRLDTLQAAILRTKLRHLEVWTEKRRSHARHYASRLEGLVRTPVEKEGRRHVFHLYVIRTPKRDELMAHLERAGVSAGIHYPIPLHLQPAYASLGGKRGDFPVAERCAAEMLSLPMYADLTADQVDYVCDQVACFFGK